MKAKDVAAALLEHPEWDVTVWTMGQGGRVVVSDVEAIPENEEFVLNPGEEQ
jgi:hypothetical protein